MKLYEGWGKREIDVKLKFLRYCTHDRRIILTPNLSSLPHGVDYNGLFQFFHEVGKFFQAFPGYPELRVKLIF